MERSYEVTKGIHIIPSWFEVPNMGQVAVNGYLIKDSEPILIDTGLTPEGSTFVEAVESLIDPADLRWIYLTHDDSDHIGALHALLERAPDCRVITTFTGFGKMSLFKPVPMQQVYFLNPGETIQIGNRRLRAIRPPLFDSPATTAVYEESSNVLFSSDFFGAPIPARVDSANDVPAEALAGGQLVWAAMDSPWVHGMDKSVLAAELQEIVNNEPEWILSAHLPPAKNLTRTFCETLLAAVDHPPFVGPNQAALQAMMAQMGPPPA